MHNVAFNPMHQRAFWHDYRLPSTYMLTLVVAQRWHAFGTLIMGRRVTGRDGKPLVVPPYVLWSELGRAVKETFKAIGRRFPQVRPWNICLMPDHLHVILQVMAPLPEGQTLDTVVDALKAACDQLWWEREPAQRGEPLFEDGYCDKILKEDDQYGIWKRYLQDNPRRLAVKLANPELFTIINNREVAGRRCQLLGNEFLLDYPDRLAVIVHHDYYRDEVALGRLCDRWLEAARRGAVLMSAAIDPTEKKVMRAAMDNGGRVVVLRKDGFLPKEKPHGEAFDVCAAGRLLMLSPGMPTTSNVIIRREECLSLNEMALQLMTLDFSPGGRDALAKREQSTGLASRA